MFDKIIIVANTKQKKPAKATVVNFGVSFLHLRVTEKTEKPIEDVKPNTKPINDFSPVFPIAIIIMAFGNDGKNSLIGFIFGITSSIGFSVFSVSLRWRKETPKFTTVAIAGLFCVIFAALIILIKNQSFFSSSYNSTMFSLHGTLVCLGLILYSIGSKAIQAAELTLLSLTEVIGGIFWVWLPLFGINEVPSSSTIIGGFFLFMSIIYYSLIMKWNKRHIALN
mgnify:CR=1 FL=1